MVIWERKRIFSKGTTIHQMVFQEENQFLSKTNFFHDQDHFENAMQGLVGSHDHLLGGLDVFPTDLNYV